MQFQIRECDDSCQPPPRYSNPPVVVEEHRGGTAAKLVRSDTGTRSDRAPGSSERA